MISLLLPVLYLIFISLGLPDAMLGAAWPTMYPQFEVPVSYAGAVSMIIAFGTIISSLLSDRINRRLGTGKVAAISVAVTCVSLLGFSTCSAYWMLCLWAIPYGLGAGAVDASMNNYVALHYESRHMSWLHCMWGVGAALGPMVMGAVLSGGQSWQIGYRFVSLAQAILTVLILLSLPLWKKREAPSGEAVAESDKPLALRDVIKIRGAKNVLIMFFCYCALEQTALLWSSSYLVLAKGVDTESAARFASMFCIGITAGRFLSGFITMKLSDANMIRLGQGLILGAIILMVLPIHSLFVTVAGLILAGLGCAPIYPCVIHSTPVYFGADNSQAVIGMQMAAAYAGTMLMPVVFGFIARNISASLFPIYLLLLLILMLIMHEGLLKTVKQGA